jgi:hypothetical protein
MTEVVCTWLGQVDLQRRIVECDIKTVFIVSDLQLVYILPVVKIMLDSTDLLDKVIFTSFLNVNIWLNIGSRWRV